ncbi:MAG: Y-family DNA polymerase [Methylotenera sp.]|jgi:DNA polymerase V|nr:Y-family DNA polymerase [Methylotenera sp.]MDP1958959.1 Y-family DNA polymerase [Methylotenera sp.]MDP2404233.1 Y-family DNA polymerase [Methylotenera sp.]
MVQSTQQKEQPVRQIALVDAKNFYCESERVHNISLRGKPLVVLSNNDGCPVSRSDEAKALGVAMASAWFKYKDLAKKHGIIALSSNYPLYADMSNRLMAVLRRFSPDQEIYSIDECFLDLTPFKRINLTDYGQDICRTVLKGLGLPVRVGIGSTKTLAKLANHCAKKRPEFNGVCNFNAMSPEEVNLVMSETEIGDLWGVGRRLAPQLIELGICNVLDLKNADPNRLREQFSVVMEKAIRELNGVMCIEMEEVPPPKQQIMSSKSFGRPITELVQISEAVTAYMCRAAEKLRSQKSAAGSVHVFLRTSEFKPDQPYYSNAVTIPLPTPTDDSRRLVNVALWALKKIYRPGFNYSKAGVMLGEIVPLDGVQTDLFSQVQSNPKSDQLMAAMDAINKKWGRSAIKVASEGFAKPWAMRQENKSPCWTTKWEDLPVIYD